MGSGCWTQENFRSYSTAKNINLAKLNTYNVNQFYTSHDLNKELDPKNIIRECVDSTEHPNTIPIILALDVTGSMGSACAAVASKLNSIMKNSLSKFKDIEFCIMGIGDLSYDNVPIQMSQYESDIRIIESLDKIYFERGGGGNQYESYTAAWYMGLYHTSLDCWKRNKKGIIITMGDEYLNPYLPKEKLFLATGDKENGQFETDTNKLYKLASEKFDIYHIAITDPETSYSSYANGIEESFGSLLKQNLLKSNSNKLPEVINQILEKTFAENNSETLEKNNQTISKDNEFSLQNEISW